MFKKKKEILQKCCDYCVFNQYGIRDYDWRVFGNYNIFCSSVDWQEVFAGRGCCENFLPRRRWRWNLFVYRSEVKFSEEN